MADLRTSYLGIELKNPIVAGASALTSNIQTVKRIAESGAGALVVSSLFEEQVQLSRYELDELLHRDDHLHAEMTSMFPDVQHAGPDDHLAWVKRAKGAVDIPVIASLNAVNRETWIEYAQKLEGTGVDALELNFYSMPIDFDTSAEEVEREQIETLKAIKRSVSLPIAVKLSSFYTSPLNFIGRLDAVGVDGFVLFNRLFHPRINIERETNDLSFNLSNENDHRLALRYAGILHGKIKGAICASNGIHSARSIIEVVMAGADAVQVVSTLFRNKIEYLATLVEETAAWMDKKGYATLDEFRGTLSREKNPDPWAYTRAKYVKVLRTPGQFMVK